MKMKSHVLSLFVGMSAVCGMAAESLALSSEAVKYATIVVATLPILAAYPFLQRYFVKGVMVGAVKG